MDLLISQHQEQLMSAMPWVINYKKKLDSLNNWWSKIALIGKINSHDLDTMIFSDMNSTKQKLTELQTSLIDSLLVEEVKKLVLDSSSRAQVAIDILIRNLFERTADVGFLATDPDIRSFLLKDVNQEEEREALRLRLEEYENKYSVYYDIIVMDVDGRVQVQLDMSDPIERSSDPLIYQTVHTEQEYVENYRFTDLKPNRKNTLVYSCKITETNAPGSRVIGVLCLFFKIQDEMEGIFNNLNVADSNNVLMLTNSEGRILFCNNKSFPDAYVHKPSLRPELVNIGGTDYISTTVKTKGYQGFYGLGWYGRSMFSLKSSFSPYSNTLEKQHTGEALLSTSSFFSDSLKDINVHSRDVNEDLKLIVLNGIITAARAQASEFVPVLEEIKKIGDNTAAIFSDSIQRLRDTVLSSRLTGVRFIAELAVDIMDRNLYERANDCRWWALTTTFREHLAEGEITEETGNELSAILTYINQLYTVYTNLYLYDHHGTIVAISDPGQKWMIGTKVLEESGAEKVLKISDSQKYIVSDFIETPYYQDKHTYIYNASVTALSHSQVDNVVGGIGIVFDSEPQFCDMLTDTLPKTEHGTVMDGCFGLFVERSGRVISATEQSPINIGEVLSLKEKDMLGVENGESLARMIVYQEVPYVVGVSASKGYREYKTTGDYTNDVLSVIFIPI